MKKAILISTLLLIVFGDHTFSQKSINWETIQLSEHENSLSVKLKKLTNNALKYVLHEEIGALEINGENLYVLGGNTEYKVRPPAQTVMALGIALALDMYDSLTVGLSQQKAKEIFVNLTKTLVNSHIANGGSWGDCWQCAHWAFYCGFGAWISMDLLDAEASEGLKKMVIYEASRFNIDPPYCNDCTDDTKAEENAWNANILVLAMAIAPEHKENIWWKERASQWMLSAYARESDLQMDSVVDGKPVKSWISGWNMREEAYVFNHNRIHPDYTAAALMNLWNTVVFTLANQMQLQAAFWNMELIYKHLVDYHWTSPPFEAPGGTTYRRDSTTLYATVYYPNGTDWTKNLVDNFLMIDILCSCMGLDHMVEISGIQWAETRADYLLWMQSRSNTGQLYTESDNLTFPPKESKAASIFSFAYLTLKLKDILILQFKSKP